MDSCKRIIATRHDIDKIWLDCKIESTLKGQINTRLDYCTDSANMIKKRAYEENDLELSEQFIKERGG